MAKFGALFVNPGEIAEAHRAEEMGYDSIWVAGHMLWPNPTAEVLTSLGYLAARTSRVQLGSAILLLPLYNALTVAKGVAMLQSLAGGRVVLGVGIGGEYAPEFEAAGVDRTRRGRITNDQLLLMRTLWHEPGKAVEAGKYRVDAQAPPLYPEAPPAPLLIGGRTTPAMRRAARLGDGILPYFVTPEGYRDLREQVLEMLDGEGRSGDDFQFATAIFVSLAPSAEEGREAAVDYIRWQYNIDGEPLVDRYAVYGPAERCAKRLNEYVNAGVGHFVVIPVGKEPLEAQLPAILEATRVVC